MCVIYIMETNNIDYTITNTKLANQRTYLNLR